MGPSIYVVQSFSRRADGAILFEEPAFSRDRDVAVALSRTFARRRAGVIALGARLDGAGRLSPDAEVIVAQGCVPMALIAAAIGAPLWPLPADASSPEPVRLRA
jgi:hypothetical protein